MPAVRTLANRLFVAQGREQRVGRAPIAVYAYTCDTEELNAVEKDKASD